MTERKARLVGRILVGAVLIGVGVGVVPWLTVAQTEDPYDHLPDAIELTGTARDFRERNVRGGHPDFELLPGRGEGHYAGIVADRLDDEGRPAFASTGHRVLVEATDAEGRVIAPSKDYMATLSGDVAAQLDPREGRAVTSAARFGQWFRDVPGVNLSDAYTLTLTRKPGTSTYVFDDRLDPKLAKGSGFFIVNDKLFGNSRGGNQNFHFTYELQMEFLFQKGLGQTLTFRADDDMWVFIDDRLVVDLGGVHEALEQTVNLDRLTWLQDGVRYRMSIFYAERHRPTSAMRIEASVSLKNIHIPTVSALSD